MGVCPSSPIFIKDVQMACGPSIDLNHFWAILGPSKNRKSGHTNRVEVLKQCDTPDPDQDGGEMIVWPDYSVTQSEHHQSATLRGFDNPWSVNVCVHLSMAPFFFFFLLFIWDQKKTAESCTKTVATQPRQLRYSNNLSKKNKTSLFCSTQMYCSTPHTTPSTFMS